MIKMISKQDEIIIGIVIVIVLIPTIFFVSMLVTYGSIQQSQVYKYAPSNPSRLQKVVLHTDLGQVHIRYNQTPTPFYAKIDMDAKVQASYSNRRLFNDFFQPVKWENKSSTGASFRLQSKPRSGLNPLRWFTQSKIQITVTLRTDIIYQIIGSTRVGTINLSIPNDVYTDRISLNTTTGTANLDAKSGSVLNGSVNVKTTTGSAKINAYEASFNQDITATGTTGKIFLNFTECDIEGDLTGIMSTGSMEIVILDCKYSNISYWDFTASTGDITVNISQSVTMEGDIIGDITVTTGEIMITYRDTRDKVGATFTGATNIGEIDFVNSGGFKKEGNRFISEDYSTADYTYDFDLVTTTGKITVNGGSNI